MEIAIDNPPDDTAFVSPANVAQTAVWLLAASIVVSLIDIIAMYREAALLGRILDGGPVSLSEARASDSFVQLTALLSLASLLACAAVFIVWVRRCYRNLRDDERRYSPGWAIGGWFVPVLSLWRPKQIVNDLARSPLGTGVSGALVTAWWVVFLVASMFGNVAGRATFSDDTASRRDADYLNIGSDLISIVAAVLAILVVRQITRGQLAGRADPQPLDATD